MKLALAMLNRLINDGYDFADAEYKVLSTYPKVNQTYLCAAYDAQYQ